MKLRQFFTRLNEGGNLSVDGHEAQHIDLKVHNRSYIVPILDTLLQSINNAYSQQFGGPMWNPKVLKSREFLSGSSLHFFNTDIPDEEFIKVKPKVGDIDTQVNKEAEPNIEQFLNANQGKVVGNAKFLGYSRGNEQFSSLWELTDPPIKVQIDLEFVKYEKDKPTAWSAFSHSSSWDDLGQGIKGVFHKFLIQSFTKLTTKEFLLRKMVGRGKARVEQDVPTTDNMLSFAVSSKEGGGLRPKYEPVLDEKGRPLEVNGLPVMRSLAASGYEQDIGSIFQSIFDKRINSATLKKVLPKTWSFVGLLEIMNMVLEQQEKEQVLDAFVDKLFAPGAQGLYKGDPQRDLSEKNVALNYALKTLQIAPPANLEQMRQDYVKNYKVTTEGPVGLDRPIDEADEPPKVQAQLRKGMPHLRDLKPADFLDLLDELQDEGGRFKLQNIPLNVKIDGFGGRFGKNAEGQPFMGTSRTEPRYSAGFLDYHKQKGTDDPEILGRAANFDKLFNEIMSAISMVDSKLGKDYLVDKQVTCEVLFLPFATQTEEGKLKFVGIEYDQLPKGVELVLVPYNIVQASTGQKVPNEDEVVQKIAKLGKGGNVMFMSNRLVQEEGLDVTEIINVLDNLDELKSIVSDTAGKRDKVSLQLRREVEEKLKPVQIALEKAIDEDPNIVGKDNLGQDYEGIVINSRLGPIKVTSQRQKDIIAQKQAAKASARAERPRENSNKTAVVAIGSFVGHRGHEELWDYTIKKAAELGGDPYLFMGNAVGKDDPIPVDVKLQTWHKMYPEYAKNISGTMAGGSLMQKIKHELINPLPGKPPRYDNIVIMVGADQAGMNIAQALMKAVNKFQGYEHVKVTLEPTPRGTGMSFTKLRNILKDPSATPEQQYALWAQGFDEAKLGKEWILHLMDITRKGMGITQQPQKPAPQPVAERLFTALIRPRLTEMVGPNDRVYHSGQEYEDDLNVKAGKVAEFLHDMNPGLFSRYGDEFVMNVAEKISKENPTFSITQLAGAVIRHLKTEVDEARMSAAVKLQRAFGREQEKSAASRKRGEEVMAQARSDWEKKQAAEKKDKGVAEGSEELHAQLQLINQKLKLMRGGPVGEPNSLAFVEKRKSLLKQKEQILSQLKQGVAEGSNEFSVTVKKDKSTYPEQIIAVVTNKNTGEQTALAGDPRKIRQQLKHKFGIDYNFGQQGVAEGLTESGNYLYCQNPECGVYLGSLGGNWCPHCGWEANDDEQGVSEGWKEKVGAAALAGAVATGAGANTPKVPLDQAIRDATAVYNINKAVKKQKEKSKEETPKKTDKEVKEFAPDGFNGGDDGDEFSPEMAKMAQDDGFTKGASLADGATTERAMKIQHWDQHDGGMYKQYFAKGFKQGRLDKIRHNNKQYNLNLKLMKDGSIRHGERGVAEYGDTAKGQKMLGKVQKRAVDRVVSKKADTDPKYAKKNQDTADRAWDRMADKDLEEKMLSKSAFAGSDKNKLGPAAHLKGSMKRPVRQGDFVGGMEEEKQRLDPKCWTGYKKQGTKMKGGVRVNNCVPVSEDVQNIMDTLINKIIFNEAIQNIKR